ncbi:uncharacterized protein LOC124151774 isoform X1 [Haliotis rufescens]|uniref:uncharacterized protein LOC124151774 isoform X1 n=2 Tax=Haliotis rufescens TaxID=6454 RepID=UPI00201F5659|nr:uncharacterized protein LOC124151774 isoform X1 [Haliotis rufescens]
MAKLYPRVKTASAVLELLLLVCVILINAKTPKYEFEIDFQHKPVPWHKCPQDWIKYGGKCYKVILDSATWDEAKIICKSYGGTLVKIKGFNKNKGIAKIIKDLLKGDSVKISAAAAQYTWIGFQRASNGSYAWSDGETTAEQQGFWSEGNPLPYKHGSSPDKCTDVDLLSSKYGEFRWSLRGCEKKKPFVCEVRACNKHSQRCADGKKCYCKYCRCDGQQDCQDGSDEWDCDHGRQCGGELSGASGTFHTTNFPKKYPKHTNCVWRIATPVGTKVQLEFVNFDVESKYDSAMVYDGADDTSRQLGKFTGNKRPVVPLASGNFLLVKFKSDHSKEKYGFNATWNAVTFSGTQDSCGGQLSARRPEAWFSSPQYPNDYPESIVCDWTITAENSGDIVTLQFEDFELESPYDWVEVRDGSNEDDGLFERFTGDNLPKIIMSSGRSLFVRMKTDFAYVLRGFNATYSSGCDVTIRSGHAKIESPGYGVSNYPNDINCFWRLLDPQRRELSLIFQANFDTETSIDQVFVYNTSQEVTGSHASIHSGRISPRPSRTGVGEFFVRFTTDERITRPGWTAAISFDCPALDVSSPLNINTTETAYSTVVSYFCDEGFLREGAANVICDMGGFWRPDKLPVCIEIDCGSPGVPANAVLVTLDKTTFGGEAIYQCLEGYNLIGQNQVTCSEQGWSPLPVCELVTCPKVQAPVNGRVDAEENHYGAVITYYCNNGYHLVGSAQAYCTADGTWSAVAPTCQPDQCPAIQGVTNGRPNVTGPVKVGESVSIDCNHGYRPDKDNVLLCQEDGLYDKNVPACLDINECTEEGLNTCDFHRCVNQDGGFTCQCEAGYQHPDGDRTRCEDINECDSTNGGCNQFCNNSPGNMSCSCIDGYFLYPGPDSANIDGQLLVPGKTCIATCSGFNVTDGKVFIRGTPLPSGEYIHPAVAYIDCQPGYVPDGPGNVTCQLSGGWTATVTRCTATLCPHPDNPPNGDVVFSSLEPGGIVSYSCDFGFILVGPDQRFCELQVDPTTGIPRHDWSGDKPTCEAVDCGVPARPENGEVHYSGTGYKSVATFTCLCGYILDGSAVRTCQAAGSWSGNRTHCNVRSCPRVSSPAYGSIVGAWETFPVGSVVSFQCDRPGYQLSDPWPLECIADPHLRISLEKPDYLISLSVDYQAAASISQHCVEYYGWESVRNLQAYKAQLQLLCTDHGQPVINIYQTTHGSAAGSVVSIQGSVGFQVRDGEAIATACQCGSAVLAALVGLQDLSMMDITASAELGCPAVSAVSGSISSNTSQWKCPPGLILDNGNSACGENTPMCLKKCLEELEPTPIPTTSITFIPTSTTVTSPAAPEATTDTEQTTTRPLTPTTQAVLSSTTGSQTTQGPSTQAPTTGGPSSQSPTAAQTSTAQLPTSQSPTTEKLTSQDPTTQDPATQGPTTQGPTTQGPTTQGPTTQGPTTQGPTTQGPTTQGPTTQGPTTQGPTTQGPTTQGPTTQGPTTQGPTTQGQTTQGPTTQGPTTQGPTTQGPTTQGPTTQGPTTQGPPTQGPSTQRPTTQGPTTQGPTTQGPPTQGPSTQRPTTQGPTTQGPTQGPTTQGPPTQGPSTQRPTTQGPTTQGPTTQGPTTQGPTTQGPTTQGPSITTSPSLPEVTVPVFIVEVFDSIEGIFSNSCIDKVHLAVNSKVNQLPTLFNVPALGHCAGTSDIYVTLLDGRINFSTNRANVAVTYGLKYNTSSKESVEACAAEFIIFTQVELPKLLRMIQDEVIPTFCSNVTYISPGCNITRNEWGCEEGFILDSAEWVCVRGTTAIVSTPASTTAPPAPEPVPTVPRMILTLRGSFVSSGHVSEYCIAQYHSALITELRWMEAHVQTILSEFCKDVFVSVTENLTLSADGNNKINGVSRLHFYPLSESVDHSKMLVCYGYAAGQLTEPKLHLTTLTLTGNKTHNCSDIKLSPEKLETSNSDVEIYCPDGYVYDKDNFKCIEENVPTFVMTATLRMEVSQNATMCTNQLAVSTGSAIKTVVTQVMGSLQNRTLCDATSQVLLQLKQGQIAPSRKEVMILIPFGLLSMSAVKSDVQKCAARLKTYLGESLERTLTSLPTQVTPFCGPTSIIKNSYRVTKSEWTCFGTLSYHSSSGMCEEQGSKTKGPGNSPRRKRSSVYSNLKIHTFNQDNSPRWNTSLPLCQDAQAPVFTDCPTGNIKVELGPNGPVPANITLPTFSDNSGATPTVTYTPADFRLPYLFTKNMTVTVAATDSVGNVGTCPLHVFLVDVTPPTVICPSSVVVELYDTDTQDVQMRFQSQPINASDYSGIERIEYSPPEGTVIRMLKPIEITATVYDNAGNMASCSFVYEAQPEECPEWSLPTPEGGDKACTGNVVGNKTAFSCHLQCPPGMDFVYQPPLQYICELGGTWFPHNIVPDCTDKVAPDYDLDLDFEFEYNGNNSESCVFHLKDNILEALGPVITEPCAAASDLLNITSTYSMSIETTKVTVKVKVYIQMVKPKVPPYDLASACGKLILEQANTTNLDIHIEGCGNATYRPPCTGGGDNQCPPGHIPREEYCLECTRGTFANLTSGQCQSCPRGSYQDEAGQASCKPCATGTSTEQEQSVAESQCLAQCPPGESSPSGLVPCSQCEKGWYQPDVGATQCVKCPGDQSTEQPGADTVDKCFGECRPGYVSCCGVEPCYPCPKNTYNDKYRSTYCIQCPENTITVDVASNSSTQCIVVDQCEGHSCVNGATCLNNDTFYTCDCLPGFTGSFCETDIDDCASQPCVNGGTCVDAVNNFTCSCPPGYDGGCCEMVTDECQPDQCINGVCVDEHLAFRCECYDGFQGNLCDVNTDDCDGAPCLNSGVCHDMIADYFCDCTGTGFEGKNCEHNIDDCCVCSCLNGATCNDLINGFNCSCAPGYEGNRCEVDINECNSHPCENDGRCENLPADYNCICQPGYTGVNCETDIDECEAKPCENGGTCNDLVNDYRCDCSSGYDGRNCEINKDDCDPYPCSIQGTLECVDGVNEFTCDCLPLFTGTLCETQLDACQTDKPCASGATCVPNGDTFTCSCPPDYTGTLCSTKIDNCASKPCLNNATCIDGVYNYTCNCSSGFLGRNCEVNINECDSRPCQNGGTCNDIIDGFTCSCLPGFNGTQCETDVDDCASMPCHNEGTCGDLVNDYQCDCVRGYTGKACETEIDECAVRPCENGATCVDGIGTFECECPEEFEGQLCETTIDDCAFNNTCLNGATCVDGWRAITCVCPPLFGGEDCGKEKSDDYDLQCQGRNGSVCEPPPVYVGTNLTELTLCVWVRFGELGGNGTFLSLMEINKQNEEAGDEGARAMVELSGNQATIDLFNDLDTVEVDLASNDGQWHHVCFWWTSGEWNLWKDGELRESGGSYGNSRKLPQWLQVVAGQKFEADDDDHQFRGEVSQVNVYSSVLNNSFIQSMAANCSGLRLAGDIYNWVIFGDYIRNDVIIVAPGLCGESECPPGYRGTYCDIKIDKYPPEVEYCPEDILVVNSDNRLSVVEWEEPVFTDDVGVVNIEQTHRSGQTFAYGEYIVSYVAYDAENNSAECEFDIIVKPFDCIEPPAPLNGGKACRAWQHGHYCSIACFPNYEFVEFPPPFYRCGNEGFWDPPRGSPFLFPSCAMPYPPASSILGGGVDFSGPQCTEDFKTQLRDRFIAIMRQLDERIGLCTPKECSYDNINVECGSRRRRRDTSGVVFHVSFAVNLSANGNALENEGDTYIAEELENTVKRGDFNFMNFTADVTTLNVNVELQCLAGQSLTTINQTKKVCLDCPMGYFLNETTGDCEICLEGTYNGADRQTECTACSPDHTTGAPGAVNSSQCFAVCRAGHFYHSVAGRCELCPLGEYQNEAGQTSCKSCPPGQSTEATGTIDPEDCAYLCRLGEELGVTGKCQPCPIGSFRESFLTDFCQLCPYGWTTEKEASTSSTDCSVVECSRGEYRTEDNECQSCPKGTYQPKRGATSCIPCGPGLTTPGVGEVSEDRCYPGPVNECELNTDNCDSNALCEDILEGFNCTCKKGFHGNGTYCVDDCEGYCGDHGTCHKDNQEAVFCICNDGYSGTQCQETSGLSGLTDAMIGGIAGATVALVLLLVVVAVCFYRSRRGGKELVNDRIYRDTKPPVAFQNNAYESLDRTPSSMLRLESSSNSSDAQPWKRSVFSNPDEDEYDADWEDPLELEIMLEDFQPRQRTPSTSMDSYF